MKLVAKVLTLALAAVILLALAALLVVDPLVATAIEKGATLGTGTTTTVGGADVGIFSTGVEITDVRIQNPEGFRDEPFFELGSVRIEADAASLMSDTIDVPLIALDGVTINIEGSANGSNYGTILDHLEQFGGTKTPSGKPADPAPAADTKALRIGRVLLTNMKAKVYIDLGLAVTSTEVEIPRFELTDFESNGSTSEVVAKLTEAVIRAALEAVARSDSDGLPVGFAGDLKKQLADYGSLLEEGKAVGKQAVKDLKDLFND